MSEQSGRYQRSATGMIAAMVVLLALVGGYVGLHALTAGDHHVTVPTVDYRQGVAYARRTAHFPLVAPPRLPHGWRATTVTFAGAPEEHWHLGVLTDHGRYVGLEQGKGSVSSMLAQYVDKHPRAAPSVDVAGSPWRSWTDSGGDLALAHRAGGATTLVVGHLVPRATLVDYAASLR